MSENKKSGVPTSDEHKPLSEPARTQVTGSTIGGDVTGHDKISAGGHIVHAQTGATVIINERSAQVSLVEEPPAPGESPFKGLRFFDESDADLFFGREVLVSQLIKRINSECFLAIVGASGSGKSSLIRAGLIPTLKHQGEQAKSEFKPYPDSSWPIHIITPGIHPLKELAASLTRDEQQIASTLTLLDDLAHDPRSLDIAVTKLLRRKNGNSRLLLCVDQFEELFTLCQDAKERQQFIDNLMTATADGAEGPTTIIITLRADFYASCAQYSNLRESLARHQEFIGAMTTEDLRRAIEEPAQHAHWELEQGLVDVLLKDVGDEPGSLPLLSHALLETWKRRRGRRLTLRGYSEAGGVRGAIAKTAESVYGMLDLEQQAIAKRILLRLTDAGEGNQGTRRKATFNDLISGPKDLGAVEQVIRLLTDGRLLVTDKDSIEVAHEALIREWPTLRLWLDDDRENIRIHRQLSQATQEWLNLNKDNDALYRGARLARFVTWAHANNVLLNVSEQDFLGQSLKLQGQEKEMIRKQQLLQRQRMILGVVGVAAPLVLLLVLSLAIIVGGYSLFTFNINRTATQLAQVTQVALAQTRTVEAYTATPAPTVAPTLDVGEIAKIFKGDELLRTVVDDQEPIAAPPSQPWYVAVKHTQALASTGNIHMEGGTQVQFIAVSDARFQVNLLGPGTDLFFQTGSYNNGAQIQIDGKSVQVTVKGCLAAYYPDDNNFAADCFQGVCGLSINFGTDYTDIPAGQQLKLDLNKLSATWGKIPQVDSSRYYELLTLTGAGRQDINRCDLPDPNLNTTLTPSP